MTFHRLAVCFVLSNLISIAFYEVVKDSFMYLYISVSLILFLILSLFMFKKSRKVVFVLFLGLALAIFQNTSAYFKYEDSAARLVKNNAVVYGTVQSVAESDGKTMINVKTKEVNGEKTDIHVSCCVTDGRALSGIEEGSIVKILADLSLNESGDFVSDSFIRASKSFLFGNVKKIAVLEVRKSPFFFVESVRDALAKILDKSEYSHISKAAILGDRSGLSPEFKEAARRVGASHILAISGMHFVLIVVSVYNALQFLSLDYRINYVFIIFFCLFYMVLTGLSASVVRAGIMLIVSFFSMIFKRRRDSVTSLFFSVFFICLINKYAIFDAGLLLSFLACLGIIIFSKKVFGPFFIKINELLFYERKIYKKAAVYVFKFIAEQLSLSFSATVFTLPAILIFFGEFSVFSVFYNVVLAALFTVAMTLSLITLLLSFAANVASMHLLLNALSDVCGFFYFLFEKCIYFFSEINLGIFGENDPFSLYLLIFVLVISMLFVDTMRKRSINSDQTIEKFYKL